MVANPQADRGEHEWLNEVEDPYWMLDFGLERSERKIRLFAVACVRRIWDSVNERLRKVVEVAEQYADGEVSLDVFETAYNFDELKAHGDKMWADPTIENRLQNCINVAVMQVTRPDPHAAKMAYEPTSRFFAITGDERGRNAERRNQCNLVRDIFGNLFRPVTIDRDSLKANVVEIAHDIYQDRSFDRLWLLADALKQAGFTDSDLLAHCLEPGGHVRGCWVVDLILGNK